MPAAEGIGSPTKYLRSARPGFEGTGFFWMLKRASRMAPHSRNKKCHEIAGAMQVFERHAVHRRIHKLHAPRKRQDCRGDAERDDVGERDPARGQNRWWCWSGGAMRPSRPSRNTAAPIAIEAI